MGSPTPVLLRALALTTSLIVTGSLLLVAQPAIADTAPPTPDIEETVSSDALATVQIDGVVWDQVIVGKTVYAGGQFSNARPAGAAAGTGNVPRSNLLAYNIETGALVNSFNHVLNGEVKTVAASPDGTRLYVGGQFTTVDGVARYRVAAFDTATGALVTNFNPGTNTTVQSIVATDSTVYIGGNFTSIGGQARVRAAAVSASTGAVLPFAPVAEGGRVRAMVVSPDGSKVILGGSFTTLNGSGNPGYGLGAVDSTTGALLPWNANDIIRNAGVKAAIYSLASDGDSVYGSGYHFGEGGTLEGAFRADWANGDIVWVEDCHGDTYSVAITTNALYTASHSHYCGNSGGFPQTSPTWTIQRAMAWSKSLSGRVITPDPYGYYNFAGTPVPKLLNWWPDINVGTFTGASQGAWDVTANDDYVLYGGEFTRVNGKPMQGLVRFTTKSKAPNTDGPRLTGANFVPTAVSLVAGTARLSWTANYDRDNQYLTYDVIRDGQSATPVHRTVAGSRIWWDRPTMGFVDRGLVPGSTHTYRLRATDPFGNTVVGDSVSVTIAAGDAVTPYARAVIDDGAASYWRLGEEQGSAAYDWAGFSDAVTGSGVTRGTAGAIAGDSNAASTFSGDGTGLVATQSAIQGPDSFAIEAWFRTTSTTGGKIVGFGNAATGDSSNYDRHVYMDAAGRVVFGVYPGGSRTIESAQGLNDGEWHQVVANLGPTGMQLFIDGVRVAQRSDTTFGQPYSGYWRIGGDSTWGGDNYFDGVIDDVAIYSQPLTASVVDSHRVLSGRASVIPSAPADAYGAAVFTDAPELYWRLGESSGSSAADTMGAGNTGVYQGGVAGGATGAVMGTSNTATTFDGVSGTVASARQYSNPQVYSVEAWFKTRSSRGGKIIGFGNAASGNSSAYDRHVYLQDDGRVVFGVYTGALETITSAARFNDDSWHHVVATQSGAGLRLYLDGELSGTNPTTSAQGYDGHWRVGGDVTWGSSSNYLDGTIDEVAVYGAALDAQAVARHWSLGSGRVANTPPSAAFTSTTTDLTVMTDASSSIDTDGTIASYTWDFGDGSSATGATAAHSYVNAGSYTVTVTVTDDDGATNSASRSVTATAPNTAPVASFTSRVANLDVAVDATASTDGDGAVAGYAWQFGDGATATGAAASHSYAASGDYTITLAVTDDDGATSITTSVVTVTAPPPVNLPPVASFATTATDLAASFDGSASSDSDGTVTAWSWSFGDGSSATGRTASHTFPAAGTYPVTLTVTDDDGASHQFVRQVTVTAPVPPATAIATDSFARTAAAGLGAAPVGGAWTTSGGSSYFSVDGSRAVLANPKAGLTLNAFLPSVSSTDTDVQVSVGLNQASSGSGTYASLIGRRVGSADYRARVVISSANAVTLQLQRSGVTMQSIKPVGLVFATGDRLQVRLQVTGVAPTTLRAKVWKLGSVEPTAWSIVTTDAAPELQSAGHVGLGSYVSASSTVLPLAVTFDDLSASRTSTAGPVTPPANVAPVAAFTTVSTDLSISADGSGSTDPDGTVASHSWDFGDGSTATGATATHRYAAAGSYTVTLTVTDNSGAVNSVTKTITVTAPVMPGPVTDLATDAFGRTASASWGSADAGGAWTATSNGSMMSVANGSGLMQSTRAGSVIEATLGAVSTTSADVQVTMSLQQAVTGTAAYTSVVGRTVGAESYRARVVVNTAGQVNLQLLRSGTTLQAIRVAGLAYATGDQLRVRLQVTGTSPTTVRAKVWRVGEAEPTAWQLSTTDATASLQAAGSVGLGSYLAANSTTVPFSTAFDEFRVTAAQ